MTRYDTVDNNTCKILKQLLGSKVEVAVNNDGKQVGCEDCGLFAIANCICLAEINVHLVIMTKLRCGSI